MTQEEQDIRFMKMALDEAKAAASEGEIPVGAIVVCKGRSEEHTSELQSPTTIP